MNFQKRNYGGTRCVYHGQVVGKRFDPVKGGNVPLVAQLDGYITITHYHNNGRGKDGERSPGYKEFQVIVYPCAWIHKPGKNSWLSRAEAARRAARLPIIGGLFAD